MATFYNSNLTEFTVHPAVCWEKGTSFETLSQSLNSKVPSTKWHSTESAYKLYISSHRQEVVSGLLLIMYFGDCYTVFSGILIRKGLNTWQFPVWMQFPLQIVLLCWNRVFIMFLWLSWNLLCRLGIWGLNFFLNVGNSLLEAWHGSIYL